MSEMLGNRYFLARQFSKAIPYLEEAVAQNPVADKMKKKLVICFIQVGQIEHAFSLFYELVQKNPHIISDTDVYYDDCPCGELIPVWERKWNVEKDSVECLEILAMLYLYCNVEKSREYFNQARDLSENPTKIISILSHLAKV